MFYLTLIVLPYLTTTTTTTITIMIIIIIIIIIIIRYVLCLDERLDVCTHSYDYRNDRAL